MAYRYLFNQFHGTFQSSHRGVYGYNPFHFTLVVCDAGGSEQIIYFITGYGTQEKSFVYLYILYVLYAIALLCTVQ